jgi:hypothetical protein
MMKNGCEHGRAMEDWLPAEVEILAENDFTIRAWSST